MRLKSKMETSKIIGLLGVVFGSVLFLAVLILGNMGGAYKTLSNILGWVSMIFVVGMIFLGSRMQDTEDNQMLLAEQRPAYLQLDDSKKSSLKHKVFVSGYLKRRENQIFTKGAVFANTYLASDYHYTNSVLVSTVAQEFSKDSEEISKDNVIIFTDSFLTSMAKLFGFLEIQKELLKTKKIKDICVEIVVFGKQFVSDVEMELSPISVDEAIATRNQSLHAHYLVFSNEKQINQFRHAVMKNLPIPKRDELDRLFLQQSV